MAFLTDDPSVPRALRVWFVVHFVADVLFAVPLLVAPVAFGQLLGFTAIDPVTARLVGAALIGIGTESLLGRNAPGSSFATMLRLKMLWSSTATLGLGVSIAQGAPPTTWLLLIIFAAFCALWTSWYLRRGRFSSASTTTVSS